jgi:hypothetical protein
MSYPHIAQDRSDEIRVLVFKQRIDRFMKYLKKVTKSADMGAEGSGSAWNNAYADALDKTLAKAEKVFSGKEDKPDSWFKEQLSL